MCEQYSHVSRRVKALLAKTESVFTSRCERRFHHPPHMHPIRYNAPWVHIIVACIEFALSTLELSALVMHREFNAETENLAADFPAG